MGRQQACRFSSSANGICNSSPPALELLASPVSTPITTGRLSMVGDSRAAKLWAAVQRGVPDHSARRLLRGQLTKLLGGIYPILPTGCISPSVRGMTYYLSGNTWFQSAFSANRIYYRVAVRDELPDCDRDCAVPGGRPAGGGRATRRRISARRVHDRLRGLRQACNVRRDLPRRRRRLLRGRRRGPLQTRVTAVPVREVRAAHARHAETITAVLVPLTAGTAAAQRVSRHASVQR